MGKGALSWSNILGGGYAAPAFDLRRQRVLVGCAGAVPADFRAAARGELVGEAVQAVPIARRGADLRNGGFPPFSVGALALVAWRYVARHGQALVIASENRGSRIIASLRTAAQRRAQGGGGVAAGPGRRGGVDPLAPARAGHHPRRTDVRWSEGDRPKAVPASAACRFQGPDMARTSTGSNGVGGFDVTRATKPVGGSPKGPAREAGQGAKRLCMPGGSRKSATLGGGWNRVN